MFYNKTLKRSLILFLLSLLLASLFYTFNLFNEVKDREAENAKIWIHTIEQQRTLISQLQVLFDGLEYEEEKKLRLWAKAVKRQRFWYRFFSCSEQRDDSSNFNRSKRHHSLS